MSFYTQFKPGAGVTKLYAGTDTSVSTSTGAVTVWDISTLQTVTDRGNSTTDNISILNTASSTSTNTGALVVSGGVGISENLNVGSHIYINGINVGYGYTGSIGYVGSIGYAGSQGTTGYVGSQGDIGYVGSVGSFSGTTDQPIITTNATASTDTTTGALIVTGGAGIGGDIYVGATLNAAGTSNLSLTNISPQLLVTSNPLDTLNSATIVLTSTAPVGYSAFTIQNTGTSGRSYTIDVGGNNRALTGGTSINEGNLTIYDNVASAYRMVITKAGNMLVGTTTSTGDMLVVNGSINATTATFSGPVTIETSLLQTTVTLVNTTTATVVDSFVAANYRSCKSFIQIQDGSNFELTEIVLLHDDLGQVYKSEYGIIATSGELGTFTADLQGDGIVRLYYTASAPSSKTIKVVKTAIAA